jgi:hypothetical protein
MVSYGGAKQSFLADLSKFIDRKKKIVTSDTGQIRMDYETGLCTVDSPAAQGVTGFLRKAGDVHLSSIDIASGNKQASILVVSMDGLALSDSKEVLVQVGTPAHLTGWEQQAADFVGEDQLNYQGFRVVKVGELPWMMDDADGTITIRNRNLTSATVLDEAGYAKEDVALTREGMGLKLSLPENSMYLVLR